MSKISVVFDRCDDFPDITKFAIIKKMKDGSRIVLDSEGNWKNAGLGLIDSNGGPTFLIESEHIMDLINSFSELKNKPELMDMIARARS